MQVTNLINFFNNCSIRFCKKLTCFRLKQVNVSMSMCKIVSDLEQETCIEVESETAVLLIETLCALECHDEVLVHDEAESETC